MTEWIDGEPLEQGYVCGSSIAGATGFDPETPGSDAVSEGDGGATVAGKVP